jgi:two-component system, OmpR family, response regulator
MKIPREINALIIDDETDICYLLSSILRHRNVKASFAGSLSEADNILRENSPPPIIFLDNHLPDGKGIDYISHLKKRYPATKVVMITAHDSQSDRKKAQQEGADFFIGKPFTKEIIFNTLDNLGA